MDSWEYPQLHSLAGVRRELDYYDENLGVDQVLMTLLGDYLTYFKQDYASPNASELFRLPDFHLCLDDGSHDLVSVVGYLFDGDIFEFRWSIFDRTGYGEYLNQVGTPYNGTPRMVPEFVFSSVNGVLSMEFVLRDIDRRDNSETLAYIDEAGTIQATDPSISEILPLAQKVWVIGSDAFLRASFSNN